MNIEYLCREAWNKLGDMNKEEAMERYIDLLDELSPDWRESDIDENQQFAWKTISKPVANFFKE